MVKSDSGAKLKASLGLRLEIQQDKGRILFWRGSKIKMIIGALPDDTDNIAIALDDLDVRDAFS